MCKLSTYLPRFQDLPGVSRFFVSQHHFETNDGLIFDYALLFVAHCRPNRKLTTNFEALLDSPYLRASLFIFRKQFSCFSLFNELQGGGYVII